MEAERIFEWDAAKAASNLAKHGVSFEYVTRVFRDAGMVNLDASRPKDGEVRRKAIGVIEGRLFIVVYIVRDGVTRIISARRGNAKESRSYGPVYSRPE